MIKLLKFRLLDKKENMDPKKLPSRPLVPINQISNQSLKVCSFKKMACMHSCMCVKLNTHIFSAVVFDTSWNVMKHKSVADVLWNTLVFSRNVDELASSYPVCIKLLSPILCITVT